MRVAATGVHSPESQNPLRQWLTVDDFCRELEVAPSTAYKWSASGTASGKFPRFRKLPNGSIRIRRDWFDEWLDSLDASSG